jgi:hypothetical protein
MVDGFWRLGRDRLGMRWSLAALHGATHAEAIAKEAAACNGR